jgi:hypothetical protein
MSQENKTIGTQMVIADSQNKAEDKNEKKDGQAIVSGDSLPFR